MIPMDTLIDRPMVVNRHIVTLRKDAKRDLTEDKVREQIATLQAAVMTPGRVSKGWHVTVEPLPTERIEDRSGPQRARGNYPTTYVFRVAVAIDCHTDRPRPGIDGEFTNIVSLLVAKSNAFPMWSVELVDGEAWSDASVADIKASRSDEFVGYAPVALPGNWRDYFSHLYDRDAQVTIVMSALEAALESDWRNRFHTVLMGPPACGKTELLTTLRRLLGDDAVLMLDGTATTQAGLTKELAEREELPRVIVIEEIEKSEESALRVLLGLLDTRGELRKVTAREKISRECRVLCFATVNDIEKFNSMLSGALGSRFAHQVYCPKPTRDLMAKILTREVTAIAGNARWIIPTLDYMFDILKSADPRKGIALCLSGRDMWLNGSYIKMLEEVRKVRDDA